MGWLTTSIVLFGVVALIATDLEIIFGPDEAAAQSTTGCSPRPPEMKYGFRVYASLPHGLSRTEGAYIQCWTQIADISRADTYSYDGFLIQTNESYNLQASPGDIGLKLHVDGTRHKIDFANTKNGSGGGRADLNIYFHDEITPHWQGHTVPTQSELTSGHGSTYEITIGVELEVNGENKCNATGGPRYNYRATAIALAASFANNDTAKPPESDWQHGANFMNGAAGNFPGLGDAPGINTCPGEKNYQGELKGYSSKFTTINGWSSPLDLSIEAFVAGLGDKSGEANVSLYGISACLEPPKGVTITSASGHDYTCNKNGRWQATFHPLK